MKKIFMGLNTNKDLYLPIQVRSICKNIDIDFENFDLASLIKERKYKNSYHHFSFKAYGLKAK